MSLPNANPCTASFVQEFHLTMGATDQVRETMGKWKPREVLRINILN